MKKNMGTTDRVLRLLAAVVMLVLYFTGIVTGTIAIILLVFTAVFILTSLVSFCPLYPLLGINTCKKTPVRK